ncbi:arsenate reductase (glutaredoxin) [Rodentibacter caecimuris]|uniref:Arsenate reductase n=1 Tax=Rodentibacter caecimuris TaxID=1796644 RepID=A0ABX3L3R5_9PAST|nr:arsenate reductase (glutaredoxin) [Rodentibacter heylii]
MSVVIYHNPRCSKSRETLHLLEMNKIPVQIELYLQKQFSASELWELARKLGIQSLREMMRTKDDLYKRLDLDHPNCTEECLLQALMAHSALLERPIVINGEKARIGRPPESVLSIL